MRKRDLTRLLIENTVDRALRDMERDAHRSLRNLVDLALTFSKGTFERHFLTLCRSMLENETSPYYQLLDRALRTCDRQTLKTFGINVGYEACSKGPGASGRLRLPKASMSPGPSPYRPGARACPGSICSDW